MHQDFELPGPRVGPVGPITVDNEHMVRHRMAT